MPPSLFRVAGGYTKFSFRNEDLAYVMVVTDNAPRPVAPPEPIHPLGERHPIEIAFPAAHGVGTLVVRFTEQWQSDVWQQLPGFEDAVDIVDVFSRNLAVGAIECTKTITIPGGGTRVVHYHGCVVTDINDSETVQLTTVTLPKDITITYTHKSRTIT